MTQPAMTFTPVRYSPDAAPPEPDFDKNLKQCIDVIEAFERGSVEAEGEQRAVRFAHAKAYGLVRGTFEILDGVPPEYAQGVYGAPGTHDALVRYSNGLSHLGADRTLGNLVGMATKVFGVDFTTSLPDEAASHTLDFNMVNGPIFFCNTAAHYTFLSKLFMNLPKYRIDGVRGNRQMYYDWVTGYGTLPPSEWAWEELLAFLRLGAMTRCQNLLLSPFFSMGAVRHGDYIAKLRIRPTDESAAGVQKRDLNPATEDEVFRPALVSELARSDYEFDFQVQLCESLETMPANDLTIQWDEHKSPFVTVARLRFPRQDIAGDDNLIAADGLSFTPWRCPPEHEPIGSLQTVRKEAYRRSSILRHELNSQRRAEPSSVADVLPGQS